MVLPAAAFKNEQGTTWRCDRPQQPRLIPMAGLAELSTRTMNVDR